MAKSDDAQAKKTPRSRLKEPSSWASFGGIFLGTIHLVPKEDVRIVLFMSFACFFLGWYFREK